MKSQNTLGSARLLMTLMLLVAGTMILASCKRDEPVKLAQREKKADDAESRKSSRRRDREYTDPSPRVREYQPSPQTETVLQPVPVQPAYDPKSQFEPITIMAAEMLHDNGFPDKEGGWTLQNNGAISTVTQVNFQTQRLRLEMKGEPALNIWPEVDLNMYNRTLKLNYYPFQRDYVTTSSYHVYEKELVPQLTPGEYQFTFRFYNNQTPPGTTEDRTVSLKSITLIPFDFKKTMQAK